MKGCMRLTFMAVAACLVSVQAVAACPSIAITQSATKARDVQGIALGSRIQDLRSRFSIQHVAFETYAWRDKDSEFEIGVTQSGRIFRIDVKQHIGRFAPDRQFVQSLTAQLTEKYGAPTSNQLPGGPAMWGLVERVTDAGGQTFSRETHWASMILSSDDAGVVSEFKMLDWRIVWQDLDRSNCAGVREAEGKVRF